MNKTTINLPTELAASLQQLAAQYFEQDNCCTAMPLFFQIEDVIKLPCPEGYMDAEPIWYCDGDYVLWEDEDMREFLMDNAETDYDAEIIESWSSHELNAGMISQGYEIVWQQEVKVRKNAFLTSEAAHKHLAANRHHYSPKAQVYCEYAFRNPEMELLVQVLQHVYNSNNVLKNLEGK
jgi:hypothetical protein